MARKILNRKDLRADFDAAEARRKDRPGRKRRPGAGRKHALDLADRLLMLLMYYRTYTTHAFLGFLFGVDDSAVGRNINPLQPLLAGIFRIPERKVALDPEDIRELFFDATERPTRRPEKGQREFYSGKKKTHTIKTQIVVNEPGRMRRISIRGHSRRSCLRKRGRKSVISTEPPWRSWRRVTRMGVWARYSCSWRTTSSNSTARKP